MKRETDENFYPTCDTKNNMSPKPPLVHTCGKSTLYAKFDKSTSVPEDSLRVHAISNTLHNTCDKSTSFSENSPLIDIVGEFVYQNICDKANVHPQITPSHSCGRPTKSICNKASLRHTCEKSSPSDRRSSPVHIYNSSSRNSEPVIEKVIFCKYCICILLVCKGLPMF